MAKLNVFLFMVFFGSYLPMVAWALNSTIFFSVNDSTIWSNNDLSFPQTTHFTDGSLARFILLTEQKTSLPWLNNLGIGCGFWCEVAANNSCYLAVVIIVMFHGIILEDPPSPPQVVWSANPDSPVGENATLEFSGDGDMILADGDGTVVWSVDSSGKSITGMSIYEDGNLVLFNKTNGIVWQSFDHPTNTLLVGQTMRKEQRLTSSTTSTNLSHGLFYLSIESFSISAFVEGDRPTCYLSYKNLSPMGASSLRYITFNEKNIMFFYQRGNYTVSNPYQIPDLAGNKFLRLDIDGGLRIYGWDWISGWKLVHLSLNRLNECQFPLKCGRYGVCKDEQCVCPKAFDGVEYFTTINSESPNLGCRLIAPSRSASEYPELVDFGHLSYFSYFDLQAAVPGLKDEEGCKQACLRTSSCKATFFRYQRNASEGSCYMPSDILSIIGYPSPNIGYNSSCHIKVHTLSSSPASPFQSRKLVSLASVATFIFVLLTIVCFVIWHKKKNIVQNGNNLFKRVSEMPVRFSYHDLCVATGKFSEKLGGGGFGSVFKGVLRDGTVIAVKRLDNTGQGTKEFLAELETIGNIHHINLVRLFGFCVEKLHRLLVYEYFSNGSLDKWIFCKNSNPPIDWNAKKKIILDTAKGLAYLHEECRQKIAHLDVKPHNILIDNNFNAKLSDFGLSKLIDRNQSQVMTSIRGTLGYLAPEWQHSRITVKADIYSFGVVLLEVVSGRKILDYSRADLDVHLLSILQRKAEENRLIDVVDYQSKDMQRHEEEVVKMIKLGMWCLNSDCTRRPPMSTVVKVLEGVMELEPNISYRLSHVIPPPTSSTGSRSSLLESSVLSIPK